MKRGVSSDAMLHCLARSSLSGCQLPLLAIFGIIILCKTSITVHYYQIIIIMKITITMIFPKESRTKSRGRCSHINVTHWHSTRLTGDKTKTNVTDCHDDDAYTVTNRDGAALGDAVTFIKEFTYLRQSPSHGVLTYTLNSTCFFSTCPSVPPHQRARCHLCLTFVLDVVVIINNSAHLLIFGPKKVFITSVENLK